MTVSGSEARLSMSVSPVLETAVLDVRQGQEFQHYVPLVEVGG